MTPPCVAGHHLQMDESVAHEEEHEAADTAGSDQADPDETSPQQGDPGDRDADGVAVGVEHLQSAARELVAAARSFLDVVEQVVEDDRRVAGAASSFAEILGRGLGAASTIDLGSLIGSRADREPTWLRNDPDHPDSPGDVFGHDDGGAGGTGAAPNGPGTGSRRSSGSGDEPRRVRRIAVD